MKGERDDLQIGDSSRSKLLKSPGVSPDGEFLLRDAML